MKRTNLLKLKDRLTQSCFNDLTTDIALTHFDNLDLQRFFARLAMLDTLMRLLASEPPPAISDDVRKTLSLAVDDLEYAAQGGIDVELSIKTALSRLRQLLTAKEGSP